MVNLVGSGLGCVWGLGLPLPSRVTIGIPNNLDLGCQPDGRRLVGDDDSLCCLGLVRKEVL